MKEKYTKNLSLICLIMILINSAGLTYQIITKASILAVCLKILYLAMFSIFLLSVIKYKKISYLVGIISSCIIIIISSIYMDFLSIAVAILIIYYLYNLKSYNFDSDINVKSNKRKVSTKKRNKY